MALVKFSRSPSRYGLPTSASAFSGFPTLDEVENRMTRFMDRVLNQPLGTALVTEPIGWLPVMDIIESPKELTVTAELPGIDEKTVDVSIEEGVLSIRGEKVEEKKEHEEDKKVYLFERSYGAFFRSFALPAGVDAAKTTAEFTKGVLKVHIPKTAEAKPKGQKIEIKTT